MVRAAVCVVLAPRGPGPGAHRALKYTVQCVRFTGVKLKPYSSSYTFYALLYFTMLITKAVRTAAARAAAAIPLPDVE